MSTSEFCSLLRLVVGGTKFDRRIIFKAMAVMDGNKDRNISIDEFSLLIYRIWKSQLAKCSAQLSLLSITHTSDSELDKIYNEKNDLKEAIKRSYPRSWRDIAEKDGHTVNGPFSSLLTHLGLDVDHRKDGQADLTTSKAFNLSPSLTHRVNGEREREREGERGWEREKEGEREEEGEGRGALTSERSWTASDSPALSSTSQYGSILPALSTSTPYPYQSSHSNSRLYLAVERPLSASSLSSSTGSNGLLRFKIKVNRIPGGPGPVSLHTLHTPQRNGHSLTLPAVRNMNEESNLSKMSTSSFLRGH